MSKLVTTHIRLNSFDLSDAEKILWTYLMMYMDGNHHEDGASVARSFKRVHNNALKFLRGKKMPHDFKQHKLFKRKYVDNYVEIAQEGKVMELGVIGGINIIYALKETRVRRFENPIWIDADSYGHNWKRYWTRKLSVPEPPHIVSSVKIDVYSDDSIRFDNKNNIEELINVLKTSLEQLTLIL